ncbi:hypothetical protein C0584_02325 [Candidatus Parcubacteria bacterium]|nr:MAG: hypothetical protein C0584_02325 [Candidatus Parcubacteria bacterium]
MKQNKSLSLILIILSLGIFLTACTTPQNNSNVVSNTTDNNSIIEDESMDESDVVTFQLTGVNFSFLMDGEEAPEIRVKEGQKVRIELTSTEGFHDFVLDEFFVASDKVALNESTSVEFVADQKGTFEYYCSVGSHRAQGMVGNFIVE